MKLHCLSVFNQLPCIFCKMHIQQYVRRNPIDLSNRVSFVSWLFVAHNFVRQTQTLRKPTQPKLPFTWEEFEGAYLIYPPKVTHNSNENSNNNNSNNSEAPNSLLNTHSDTLQNTSNSMTATPSTPTLLHTEACVIVLLVGLILVMILYHFLTRKKMRAQV